MSSTLHLNKFVIGKCKTMCPTKEMKLREKERLLHVLEMVPGTETHKIPRADPDRTVKSFNRSAAGKAMTNEDILRPPEVLLETLHYLFDDVINNQTVSWIIKYDFITDRLRAIRQDMIIQNISKAHSISLLQPIVRFYAYAAYKLCDQKLNVFDPYLNKKHLHECINRLLVIYDDVEHSLQVSQRGHVDFIKKSRPQFEALYIILNLENEVALQRMLTLSKIWRTPVVRTTMMIALNFLRNNYFRVCSYIPKLPPLLSAVSALHLSNIRKKTLHIMSVAYSCRNQTYPLSTLKDFLLYGSDEEIIEDVKQYGINLKEQSVQFDKNSFNKESKTISYSKAYFLEEKLGSIDDSILLLYGDEEF